MRNMKDDRKMREPKVLELIEDIKSTYQQESAFNEGLVAKMQELRQLFIDLKHPSLVKAVRLVYETAAAFDGFSIEPWEEENGISSLEYFLELLNNPFNKYNREEIKEMNNYLKARLAGEEVEFSIDREEEEEVQKEN